MSSTYQLLNKMESGQQGLGATITMRKIASSPFGNQRSSSKFFYNIVVIVLILLCYFY